MASFSAGTTFTDGVANDVTAAKLAALVNAATPTSGLIQDRTAETAIAVNDNLLIGDASDSNNLKRMTVANFRSAATFGTTTSTAATITSGTITTLNSTTGTITTGVIPTLTSITKITSGTGTAAAPAISPTGDTNTGVFFPAADTIAFSEGGVESMRIDSSGNVGIGTSSPAVKLDVSNGNILGKEILLQNGAASSPALGTTPSWYSPASGVAALSTNANERLRIDASGNVGIGTDSPTVISSNSKILDIVGNLSGAVRFERTSSTNPTYGYVGATNGAVELNAQSNSAIVLSTYGTERARIDSSGNVGIGTTSPTIIASSSKVLDIVGDLSGAVRFERTSSTNPTYGYVGATNGAFEINSQSNTPILISTYGTERARIGTTGNVSIGTATALSKLHVHGDLTLSNATTGTTASTSTITPPPTVAGYLTVSINGTSRKIAFYAT